MTSLAVSPYQFRQSRFVQLFRSADTGSRLLTVNAGVMLICFAACTVLQIFDDRLFNGINLWIKPGKFFLSVAVQVLTVAWALSCLDPAQRTSRLVAWSVWGILVTAWGELIYIALRAAQGEASHFNVATPLSAALYSTMAVFAVLLVVFPAVIGVKIWLARRGDIGTESIALGFGVAAVLSIVVGMTLGGNSSHWIGGDMTDATGLPLFKWSTTGGDLRVAHFIGLHVMQLVPLAALSRSRSVVWSVAAVLAVATGLTYAQALMGVPVFRP